MFEYEVCEENLYHEDIGEYVSYGIKAFSISMNCRTEIAFVSDVSVDKTAVRNLCKKCTLGNLHPIHLMDVVEDFLCNI